MRDLLITPLALFVLAACGSKDDTSGPGADDPSTAASCVPSAPVAYDEGLRAGTRVLQTTRAEQWSGEARPVPVRLYYPTDDTAGTGAKYLDLFDDPNALVDATHRDDGCGKRPLLVWSHGSQAYTGNVGPLARQLAAAGWVVAAPEHTGNTLIENWSPRPVSFAMNRVHDVLHTIDVVEGLDAADPLAGAIDTSRVVVMGHSFGGQTSWLSSGATPDPALVQVLCDNSELGCTQAEIDAFAPVEDPRLVGVIPLAGAANDDLVPDDGFASMRVPVLYMTGSEDNDGTPHYERSSVHGTVTWVELQGACHESFTLTPFPCPGMEKPTSLPLVWRYVSAFAWTHVLQVEDTELGGILDGSVEVDPAAAVRSSR